ncbi:alpha/beta hydrolase [Calidifontibacter indicus]|uniref:Alpha-beta hydrolase superfamily lysophospholipase n=1 Tax=Calidifontibacter indicus TaxID=419650 RepID=A0A3D9UIZ9_9MICO|nr:alpha/beta hydrolase [Calidifontibacter indicus]REF29412.1 alpha-beta hydrolase superfamily lysophospholipase [Calidifontibacter indicus]
MRTDSFRLATSDDTSIFVNHWSPDDSPRAIVLVAHGMAEHSDRYERFAQALTASGYEVYAPDHRGHGRTSAETGVGYFADEAGFDRVVDDLHEVFVRATTDHPDLPVFLFGHSMGSFLSRAYAAKYGAGLTGLVLSGTAGSPGALGKVGRALALAQGRVRGRRHRSGLMDKLTFGQYNAAFKPNRTDFDWLSRDPEEVDKYVADPKCGELFTAGFFADLLDGLERVNDDAEVSGTPSELPVLFVSGSADPVGGKDAKGVQAAAAQLRKVGVRDVTTTIYPEARHELLNETNRDEVTADVIAWLDAHLTDSTKGVA